MGMSPWQLPSVRATPSPKPAQQDSLTLEQLRSYQHMYPYSLQQQWQQLQAQQAGQQQERQRLLQVSSGQVVGRPGSAGVRREYQPLLQQQMELQEQLMQQQMDQPLPWQQARAGHHGISQQQCQQQRVQQHPLAAEPWHTGKPRWQSHAAAVAATGLHWAEKRAAGRTTLVPAGSSSSSSRSSSPSTASALAGPVADLGSRGQQQQRVDLRKSCDWAAKALRPVSPTAVAAAAAATGRAGHSTGGSGTKTSQLGSSCREQLPSYGGQALPKELAALFGGQHGRHTF